MDLLHKVSEQKFAVNHGNENNGNNSKYGAEKQKEQKQIFDRIDSRLKILLGNHFTFPFKVIK
jgi:hypothetical protein